MTLVEILSDKSIKKMAARKMITEGILDGRYSMDEIATAVKVLKENKVATILEAIEEISNKKLADLSREYLEFAMGYIASPDNSCKREASRIVGNLAAQYTKTIREAIPAFFAGKYKVRRDCGTLGQCLCSVSDYNTKRILRFKFVRKATFYL